MPKLNEILKNAGSVVSNISGSLSKFFSPKVATSPQVSQPIGEYYLKDRGVKITDDDFNFIRPIVFGEVSNRPGKTKLETDVIFNTMANRLKEFTEKGKKQKSIREIASMPGQYQALGGKEYNEYLNPSNPISIAKKKEVDSILDEIYNQIKEGTYQDTTGGGISYIHNKDKSITFDRTPFFK